LHNPYPRPGQHACCPKRKGGGKLKALSGAKSHIAQASTNHTGAGLMRTETNHHPRLETHAAMPTSCFPKSYHRAHAATDAETRTSPSTQNLQPYPAFPTNTNWAYALLEPETFCVCLRPDLFPQPLPPQPHPSEPRPIDQQVCKPHVPTTGGPSPSQDIFIRSTT